MTDVFDPENKLASDCCENGVFEEKDGTIHCGACTKECTYHEKKSWLRYQLTTISWMFVYKGWMYVYAVTTAIAGILDLYAGDHGGFYRVLVAVWVMLYMWQWDFSERRRSMIDRLFGLLDNSQDLNREILADNVRLVEEVKRLSAKTPSV